MLAAARIDAEAASRRGDPLANADKRHAQQLRDRVETPPPAYMTEPGAGRELVPASILGENSRALELRDTVADPNYVTVDASRDRLELANQAAAWRRHSTLPRPSTPRTAWKRCSLINWQPRTAPA